MVGFKFIVREKQPPKTIASPNGSKDFVDLFLKCDAQINMYGNQLAELRELGNLADAGETTISFASRLKTILKIPKSKSSFILILKI